MNKYELTQESFEIKGKSLYRIKALKDFGDVKKGDLGGYVEKEANLSHDGHCWVYGNAWICGNARVYGSALVDGKARVSGNALVSGNARVYGYAEVSGNAWICGNATVYGNSKICSDYHIKSGNYYNLDLSTSLGKLQFDCKNLKLNKILENVK